MASRYVTTVLKTVRLCHSIAHLPPRVERRVETIVTGPLLWSIRYESAGECRGPMRLGPRPGSVRRESRDLTP